MWPQRSPPRRWARPAVAGHTPAVHTQTAAMFLGETLCLVPFVLRRWWTAAKRAERQSEEEAAVRSRQLRRSFWVFSLPAMCDAAASTLLNLGLFYT